MDAPEEMVVVVAIITMAVNGAKTGHTKIEIRQGITGIKIILLMVLVTEEDRKEDVTIVDQMFTEVLAQRNHDMMTTGESLLLVLLVVVTEEDKKGDIIITLETITNKYKKETPILTRIYPWKSSMLYHEKIRSWQWYVLNLFWRDVSLHIQIKFLLLYLCPNYYLSCPS